MGLEYRIPKNLLESIKKCTTTTDFNESDAPMNLIHNLKNNKQKQNREEPFTELMFD